MSPITRRQLLVGGGTAALLSLSGVGGALRLAQASPRRAASIEKYGGFKMGLQSYSLRHFNLEQTIEHLADLGLHWIEFYPGHYPVTHDESRIAQVASLLEPHDIHLPVHGVHNFDGDEARNRRIFEFAKLAGIPLLSAHPSPDSFPILDKLVKEFDIKIGIHNHGPGHTYDRIEDSLKAVEPWDRRIGFCPDTGHCMRSGEDPVEMVRRMGERLYGMHLKDHTHIGRDNPAETILGEGAIDLEGMCQTLREVEFDAPISLEYELNPRDPLDDIRQGLANFAAVARAG